MNAANDTAAVETIDVGCTIEIGAWRAHRYANSIVVTHIANAGKRGKKCVEFSLYERRGLNQMDDAADLIVGAMRESGEPNRMRAILESLTDDAVVLDCRERRGVDVEHLPEIRVQGETVRGSFGINFFLLTFTTVYSAAHREDVHVGSAYRRDAAKAYRWAAENRARLLAMTASQFRGAMNDLGIRVD